jgi:molybdate transport system permease protein
MLPANDLAAAALTVQLALLTTVILIATGTPIAFWLARAQTRWRAIVAAVVAVPLVLPPSVLGFYLLLLMGPGGPIGRITTALGVGTLPFTFAGLVVGSTLYSLPFVVEPLRNAFASVGRGPLEAAATLGAGPWDRFFTIALPLSAPAYFTAAVLGFAHTVGEFGVVLMIGGNIPGRTRVLSVALYDHVEAFEYDRAHWIAGGMLAFSMLVLTVLQWFRGRPQPA